MATRIGCGQITWNQFRKTDPAIDEERVLGEIRQAGYEGAPAGPSGSRTPAQAKQVFARHGLKPAPGYASGDWWKPDQRAAILEKVAMQVRYAAELGLSELYVAAGGFDHRTARGLTRSQTAGHVKAEDALTDEQYRTFADAINAAGVDAVKHGVKLCFHNHVGTPIETRAEIDKLFSLLDPAAVFLGPDTGHLAWAGADVVQFVRDYAPRIKTVHLKDIHKPVADRGKAAEWDYGTFSTNGVFAELGEGFIDFRAVLDLLSAAGFDGWLITETDVTQKPTAFESVKISRDHLKKLGV